MKGKNKEEIGQGILPDIPQDAFVSEKQKTLRLFDWASYPIELQKWVKVKPGEFDKKTGYSYGQICYLAQHDLCVYSGTPDDLYAWQPSLIQFWRDYPDYDETLRTEFESLIRS